MATTETPTPKEILPENHGLKIESPTPEHTWALRYSPGATDTVPLARFNQVVKEQARAYGIENEISQQQVPQKGSPVSTWEYSGLDDQELIMKHMAAVADTLNLELDFEPQELPLKATHPNIYERLSRPSTYQRKMLIEVPATHLEEAIQLVRETHEQLNPGTPFLVVDVQKLLKQHGIAPNKLTRQMIYQEALKQLDPSAKPEEWPLDNFQNTCKGRVENSYCVGLFIANINAATKHMTQQEARTLQLSTFRINPEAFNIYGHTTEYRETRVSNALNDVAFITKPLE